MDTWERSIAVDPDDSETYLELGQEVIRATGDLARARQVMGRCPPDPDSFWYLFGWGSLHMLERDGAGAREWFSRVKAEGPFMVSVRTVILASAEYLEGGLEHARPRLEEAASQLEAFLAASPGAADPHRWLGMTYAFLGEAEAAQREGKLAVDLSAKDMASGPEYLETLAMIYAWTGQIDESLELIERLLSTTYLEPLTHHNLRLDPRWDPLRDDSRFQALVAGGS
jgi:tetratricopeptide (TPR) repeat protein